MARTMVIGTNKEKLSEESLSQLLNIHKTLRDPIHVDIKLTELEIAIIDTRRFQRLRSIKQLGPSYLVYNGATHTRFDHAIGTLHVAQMMLNRIDQNVRQYSDHPNRLGQYVTLLTRLCALLHDLAHIPFGHTLEDEGKLFPSQWKDKKRIKIFLGDNSEIGKIIVNYTNRSTLKRIRDILTAEDEEEIQELQYPIVVDIVGNTICADLLDYLARDLYYSGIRGTYDERFLDYLIVQKLDGSEKQRLAITLFKPVKGDYRRDVVSELLHLLRLRYTLAERIYYHHAKIAASAMLISAVNIAKNEKEEWLMKDLYKLGDDELLHKLEIEKESPFATKFIMARFRSRKLYRSIFMVTYQQVTEGDPVSIELRHKTDDLAINPSFRYELERELEKESNLPPGSVIIYCPSKEMGKNVAEVKVKWGEKTLKLKDVSYYRIGAQINAIVRQHEELWKSCVLIAPEYYGTPQADKVRVEFSKRTGLNQELEKFRIKQSVASLKRRKFPSRK